MGTRGNPEDVFFQDSEKNDGTKYYLSSLLIVFMCFFFCSQQSCLEALVFHTTSVFFPSDHQVRRRKKKSGLRRCDFTEGWVEFRDKRVAKKVAASLHNTPMGTKKRQKYYSDLWSIKVGDG